MVHRHVIVDGSNIATEGRQAPSLAQLDDAVQAFMRDYQPEIVTVVVDATFPNRIDRQERQTYEDAIDAGELLTPPAGTVGRGDAFVLEIADRSGATILSNDSFQEFHGRYSWLFDPGRLIGGKPVPHVGWVFMERTPVRGPASRKALSAGKQAPSLPAPSATPPKELAPPARAEPPARSEPRTRRSPRDPFEKWVAAHPTGSEVEAEVTSYSSHGAQTLIGDIEGYVPLKHLAEPAPRSAREVLKLGERRSFVVVAVDHGRKVVDLALPEIVPPAATGGAEPGRGKGAKRASPTKSAKAKAKRREPVTEAKGGGGEDASKAAAPTSAASVDDAPKARRSRSRSKGAKAASVDEGAPKAKRSRSKVVGEAAGQEAAPKPPTPASKRAVPSKDTAKAETAGSSPAGQRAGRRSTAGKRAAQVPREEGSPPGDEPEATRRGRRRGRRARS